MPVKGKLYVDHSLADEKNRKSIYEFIMLINDQPRYYQLPKQIRNQHRLKWILNLLQELQVPVDWTTIAEIIREQSK